jgi:hypothetical protein
MTCIKDLILRNIQAIESNFLMIDEDDEVSLGFTKKSNIDETLEHGLKRRIDQEIIKRDYYMERISRFKEWTETVLVNIDSIMRTMGKDMLPEQVGLKKQLDSERFGQPMTDSKRFHQHLRAESFNLGDSLNGDMFGFAQNESKKRHSEMFEMNRNPMGTFQGQRNSQYKSNLGPGQREREEDLEIEQGKRGFSKGSQRRQKLGDSFDI